MPVSVPGIQRLCRLAEHHDSDQDTHHSRHGGGSRSGDELRDGRAGGDDHGRAEAHGDWGTDVGRPRDDVVDRKDRDDAHEGDEPEPPPVERARWGLSWEHDLSRPPSTLHVDVKATHASADNWTPARVEGTASYALGGTSRLQPV